MRILIAMDTCQPLTDGVLTYVREVIERLTPSHEVVLATPSLKGGRELCAGCTVRMPTLVRVAGYPVALPTPELFRQVARSDVVFVQDAAPIGTGAVLGARLYHVPVCAFCHHDEKVMLSKVFGTAPFMDTYMRLLYAQCATVLFATSRFHAKLERLGVPDESMTYAPFAVDTVRFSPQSGGDWRGQWGIPEDAPVALYLGRLSKEKNISTLLNAAALVLEERKDSYFVVAGRGPLLERCKQMTQKHERLVVTGFVEDAAQVYAAADVFVLPSLNESQCFATMEAMASGLACVLPYEPPSPYSYLAEGENCTMVKDVMDAGRVAEEVLKLFESPERTQRIGMQARESMLSWSWDEHIHTLQETFNSAMLTEAPHNSP